MVEPTRIDRAYAQLLGPFNDMTLFFFNWFYNIHVSL